MNFLYNKASAENKSQITSISLGSGINATLGTGTQVSGEAVTRFDLSDALKDNDKIIIGDTTYTYKADYSCSGKSSGTAAFLLAFVYLEKDCN